MQRKNLLVSQPAEPQVERKLRVVQIGGKSARRFQVSLLNHVGDIYARLHPLVEAQANRQADTLAVAAKQFRQRLLVSTARALEELVGFGGIHTHGGTFVAGFRQETRLQDKLSWSAMLDNFQDV